MRFWQTNFGAVAHQRAVEASYFYTGGARRVEDNAIVGGCCPCQQEERREPHDAASVPLPGRLPPTTALRCVARLRAADTGAGQPVPDACAQQPLRVARVAHLTRKACPASEASSWSGCGMDPGSSDQSRKTRHPCSAL